MKEFQIGEYTENDCKIYSKIRITIFVREDS